VLDRQKLSHQFKTLIGAINSTAIKITHQSFGLIWIDLVQSGITHKMQPKNDILRAVSDCHLLAPTTVF
jgi:hypothetical protein